MKQTVRGALAISASAVLVLASAAVADAHSVRPTSHKAYYCLGHKATIVSSAKVINGTKRADVIVVLGKGKHVVNAGAGNDIVCGSNAGTNVLNGGAGNDVLVAGKLSNVLDGNSGHDTFVTKVGHSLIHSDVLDKLVRTRAAHDVVKDDSHWDNGSIPQDVRQTLAQAGTYLTAGVIAGDITGTGLQAALPAAPSVGPAPQSTILTNVMWNVTNNGGVINGETCVEASKDGVLFFKYTGEIRNGDSEGHVTTGKCMTDPQAPPAPQTVTDALNAGRDQMFLAISTKTISGHGDQTVLPDVADVVTPNSAFIKRVVWDINPSGDRARFCIEATADGTAFFHMEGHVSNGNYRAHLEGGQCEGAGEQGHGPQIGTDTGTFLLSARDFMSAGIAGGFITGTGDQATFPAGNPDTVAPTFAGLVDVRWQVSSPNHARFCVAAVDTASKALFRYMGEFEHGQAEGAITPGDCSFGNEHPNPGFGSDVAATLLAANAYLGTETALGQLTGSGDQTTMPGDASWTLGAFPANPLIKHVVWSITATPSDPTFAASFCVEVSADGTNFYHSQANYDAAHGHWDGFVATGDCGTGGPGSHHI